MKRLLPVLLATCGGLHANLIQNGSFEATAIDGPYSIYASADTTSLPGWTVTGTTCGANCVLGLAGSYTEGDMRFQAQDGSQNMDLTGGYNTLEGGLMQVVTSLVVGQRYSLTFWLGNQDNADWAYPLPSSVIVLVNGVVQDTFSNNTSSPSEVNWEQKSLQFVATGTSASIEFRNATAVIDNYVGLDNVSLDAEVPEPATFVLIGGTLLAIFYRKR